MFVVDFVLKWDSRFVKMSQFKNRMLFLVLFMKMTSNKNKMRFLNWDTFNLWKIWN